MLYLSGVKSPAIATELAAGTIGFLKTPSVGNTLDGVAIWAVDNGCFTGRYPGDDEFIAFLDRNTNRQDSCLFVAVPDVIGDAPATLDRFPDMARRIRDRGWPIALVGQDGMERLHIPWDQLDWIFLGGSTQWKLGPGARTLIAQAKTHGKRIHVGRVNSGKRFARFAALRCDSADGTKLAFGPHTSAPLIRGWIRAAAHPTLWEST